MRCLTCNAEMHLAEAIDDITMPVRGYENQTWRCSSCDDVERRLTFRRGDSRLERANQDDACKEEHGRPEKERLAASAWGHRLAKLRHNVSAWGRVLTELGNRKQPRLLAGRIAAGVCRFQGYSTGLMHRLRGSWMVNKGLSLQLPIQASNGEVVQRPLSDVRSLNRLVEEIQSKDLLAPAIAPSDTRSDHPVVPDVIINEDAVADAAPASAPQRQISHEQVAVKGLADYQNFDELWDSLGPTRPPTVPT